MYNGIIGTWTQYQIRCDPNIGIWIFEIRRIHRTCIYLRNAMDLPWDPSLVPKYQTIYSAEIECKYYPILGKYNDWYIIYFIDKSVD